jgi:hypothetical protein
VKQMNNLKYSYYLGRSLEQKYSTTVKPDHPLIFSGPDIIVGDRGKLFGIFIPKYSEFNNHYLLYSRVIYSKMAYPNNLISILLFSDKFESLWDFSSPLNWPFNNCFSEHSLSELYSFIDKSNGNNNNTYFEEEVCPQNHDVYSAIYTNIFSELQNDMNSEYNYCKPSKTTKSSYSSTREAQRLDYDIQVSTDIISKELHNHTADKITNINYPLGFHETNNFKSSFSSNFNIQQGDNRLTQNDCIPRIIRRKEIDLYSEDLLSIHTGGYVSGQLDSYNHKGILYLECGQISQYRFDPIKPIRALAFMGVFPYLKLLKGKYERLIETTQEQYEKIIRKY